MALPLNTAESQNVFPNSGKEEARPGPGRPDIRVTGTNIRKWIVTACYEKKREGLNVDEEVLRRAMCHSDTVARKCYLREDMTTTAASAMDIISMCTLGEKNYHPDPNIVAKPRSVECAVSPSSNAQSSNANESMLHFADDNNIQTRGIISSPNAVNPSSNRQSSNANESMLHFADDNNIQTIQVISSPKAVNVTEKESPAGSGGKSPGERKLSSKEEDAILNVYDDLIKSSDQIVTDHVRCSMKHHASLRVLVPILGMVKKVVDRVRYLQHKKGQTEPAMRPDDLPETQVEEETQNWVRSADSLSSASSTRTLVKWSSEETVMILKHFGDLENKPTKKEMQEAFNTIDELAPLLNVKDFQRCVDKVRNTRKFLKKNKAASN